MLQHVYIMGLNVYMYVFTSEHYYFHFECGLRVLCCRLHSSCIELNSRFQHHYYYLYAAILERCLDVFILFEQLWKFYSLLYQGSFKVFAIRYKAFCLHDKNGTSSKINQKLMKKIEKR